MTDLIAIVSTGKGTIAHVEKVVQGEKWDNIFLLCPVEYVSQAPKGKNITCITIDTSKMLPDLVLDIQNALKESVSIMETAVNIISGDGKEHMALLSALLKLGAGIRLVAYTKEGIREI
jgi:hypothetical protein